jgi:hypothetical protein
MKNTHKNILALALIVCALIMQILPLGAVCRFANPEGEPHVVLCSYFDLLPYGYGHVSPLLCGIVTVLWLLISVLAFCLKKSWQTGRSVLGYGAFLLSLAPILLGPAYMNAWGWAIAILLCAALFLTKRPHVSKKKEL